MIILDTNVLTALMRQMLDKDVIVWLDKQPRTSVWTTSITKTQHLREWESGLFDITIAVELQQMLAKELNTTVERLTNVIGPKLARDRASLTSALFWESLIASFWSVLVWCSVVSGFHPISP